MPSQDDAIAIFRAAVERVQPAHCLPPLLHLQGNTLVLGQKIYPIEQFRNIYVLGAGKAAAAMAQVTEQQLGNRITGGFIVTKTGHGIPLQRIRQAEAAHPVPDHRSVQATAAMLQLMQQLTADDLLIVLLSGGASSLLADIPPGCSLEDLQQLYSALLRCGATIHESNIMRRQLSAIKGGGLAQHTFGCTTVVFSISDVIGDEPAIIGSGPFVYDDSTLQQAKAVADKYGLWQQLPGTITRLLHTGKGLPRKPDNNDPCYARIINVPVATNQMALHAAREKAEALGYHTTIIDTALQGEARDIAPDWVRMCLDSQGKCCLLGGGETTVTVKGSGKGGRNQEFALAAGIALDANENITLLSAGTDGTDGDTDAAGAVVSADTMAKAKSLHLNPQHYLRNNDAWHFFRQTGGLLITGPTQTNVMDIVVVLCNNT